ncbi:hypothetical protein KP509_1Z074200 [Ceratopteris richardii]|nr:hypothetical protein KP509_1Z074200 [Ceratopteris richardii]
MSFVERIRFFHDKCKDCLTKDAGRIHPNLRKQCLIEGAIALDENRKSNALRKYDPWFQLHSEHVRFGISRIRFLQCGRTRTSRARKAPDSSSEQGEASNVVSSIREIPGSYGPPLLGVALDKLKYFVLQGRDEYFYSLMRQYESTVVRVNMPPGPPFFPDSQAIMLLDQKSIRVLFDTTKRKLYRWLPMLSYLDPSEPKHASLKGFCFDILRSSANRYLPEFHTTFSDAAEEWEAQIEANDEADFTAGCQQFVLRFLGRSMIEADPTPQGPVSLADQGPSLIQAWTGLQLAPQTSLGLPKVIEFLLHTFPVPSIFVSKQYNKIYKFFFTYAQHVLDVAEQKYGLDKEEACHNLLFLICFNTWGGMQLLLPSIVLRIDSAGESFQKELARDVRCAVGEEARLTMAALEKMNLVKSTLYEILRMDPPVPFQYGRAKEDFILESHDASYMKIAMRDAKGFQSPDTFMPTRFMGPEGERLLQNITWSNGPETEHPTLNNKQCAGKDFVIMLASMFIAEIYLRYDFIKVGSISGEGLTARYKLKVLRRR